MSLALRLLNHWLRWTEKPFLARVQEPDELRRGFERKARLFFHKPRGTRVAQEIWADRPALRVSAGGDGPLVLYFHGGAYLFGSPRTHAAMIARLCSYTGGQAVLPWYPLAPEHPFPAALDHALAAYSAVTAAHGPVVIGGDSAGGGLALALLARLGQTDLPQPLGCFAFSPLTDLAFSGDSVAQNAQAEVILPSGRAREAARMYLGDTDPLHPEASPLYADYAGAPPVWLAVGDTEILLDDTRRMVQRLEQQGVQVTHRVYRDHPHVWPIFQNLLPEARQTLRDLAQWIKETVG